MKYFMKTFVIILVALLSGSQLYSQVTCNYDKNVDFTTYKTYRFEGWQDESDKILNDLDKKRLLDSFSSEFKSRNLQYVKEGGDIVVTLYVVIENKTSTTAYTNYNGGMGYGYGVRWGYGMGSATTTYSENDYQVGTMVVDVYDGKSKQLVWQGSSRSTISKNIGKRDLTIIKKVKKLMKKYPVKPIK